MLLVYIGYFAISKDVDMKINSLKNLSFQRAFTTAEKKEYMQACEEAEKELGIRGGKTIATIFDVQVPKAPLYDIGSGTLFGSDAQELAGFFKGMFGINGIQLAPQGQISNYDKSPYSGTSFSLGAHLIDPESLCDNYNLLSRDDVIHQVKRGGGVIADKIADKVHYDRIFDSEKGFEPLLKKAYRNFEQLDETDSLKKEFSKFKKDNSYWLHKDALFEACAQLHNVRDMRKWPLEFQNTFETKKGNQKIIKLLEKVTDKQGDNVVDYNEFIQFIADKQLKDAKEKFNSSGIDLYTDCPVAFSQKDYWAHKSAFHPTQEFGCDGMGGGKYNCWGAAPDFSKLHGEAGELLKQKFDMAFSRYDGVRVDAAWQYIKPMIVEPIRNGWGEEKFENGNKMGYKVDVELPYDSFILEDIIMKSADEHGVKRDDVFLEMLGGNSYPGLEVAKKSGGTLIHISRYGGFKWGNPRHYESLGDNHYQNMKPGSYIFGIGAHDDPSAIHQSKHPEKDEQHTALAQHLNLNEYNLRADNKNMLSALYAQLYTTKSRFFTMPDILGQDRRINTPNTIEGNWVYRAPRDIERAYYENVAQGHGLNRADALSKVLRAKTGNSSLAKRLNQFAKILKEDWKGAPMTTKEADKYYKNKK